MSKLKELTWENHKKAERSAFVKKILQKKITEQEYMDYIVNQYFAYSVLEKVAAEHGLFEGIEAIQRTDSLYKDVKELETKLPFTKGYICHATVEYIDYIEFEIGNDPSKLLAHIYVRHMGDLSGGQILKNLVPGSGHHYQFDEDANVLKEKLRAKLNDDMANEANTCFDMIYKMFEELENRPQYDME